MKVLVLVGLVLVDIVLAVLVAHQTGWAAVLVAWALAIGVGLMLMRSAAVVLGPALSRGALAANGDDATIDALVTAFAAVLFILPGFLSDVLAVLLVLPPVKQQVNKRVAAVLKQRGGMLEQVINDVSGSKG